MVGQHDELVGTRRELARAFDSAELLIELSQRLERVGPLEPRVMRDLVVTRERGVHGGTPAHHVGEHAEHDQVADDHAQRGAKEWIATSTGTAGADVTAPRA